MGFEARHYQQLRRLQDLVEAVEQETLQRRVVRRMVLGALLIAFGVICLGTVIALVLTTSTAFYPISLGAVAGWTITGGVSALLPAPTVA